VPEVSNGGTITLTGRSSTSIVVRYPAVLAGVEIGILVNGDRVDEEIRSLSETDGDFILQTWYDVPLEMDEENEIVVTVEDFAPISFTIVTETAAQNIDIAPITNSRIRADGRSTVTLQGTITDADGNLIEGETSVTLTSGGGEFIGADNNPDRPGFQVLAIDGNFTAELRSGVNPQTVRVRAAIDEFISPVDRLQDEPLRGVEFEDILPEAYTQVEFIPNLRPSIVAGVTSIRLGAGGTDFYGSLSDFLDEDRIDDGTEFDFHTSAFAMGPIGEWLLTSAFNTSRSLNETCDGRDRLFREGDQFCDNQYPTYGDSSTVQYLTPSRDSVYLRLERAAGIQGAEADFFMWGDYHTNEFNRVSQLYSATTRALHGFKTNYNFGNLQITGLYSNDIEGFQRDVIVPDGTSGEYFLSHRLVVPGSERVYIESEEFARPGTVLDRQEMARGPDYEINYDDGSIRFRRPILSTEFDLFGNSLVNRIVVIYEFESDGDDTNLYAGRVQYNFNHNTNRPSFFGASYWREDEGDRDYELYGLDFIFPWGENGSITGEFAHSSNESIFRDGISGSAYRLEANGRIASWLTGQAFYRSVDDDFVNNSSVSFSPGQTRYGANLAARLSQSTQLRFQFDREINDGFTTTVTELLDPGIEAPINGRVDNSLTTFRAGLQQRFGDILLGIDYVNRDREDNLNDTNNNASQLISRLTVPLMERVTFQAQNELNLGEEDDFYPDRTTLGLIWSVMPGIDVRLTHQFFTGGEFESNSITSLDTVAAYDLNENTRVSGRYSILGGFEGMRGEGALGIRHGWTVLPGLRVNLAYEHIFRSIFDGTARGPQFAQPFAVGQTSSRLGLGSGDTFSAGFEYTANPDLRASARVEHRSSNRGDNTAITASLLGKITPSLTGLVNFQQNNAANQLLDDDIGNRITLRTGLAYRNPNSDRFNALFRYEFRQNPAHTPESLLFGSNTDSTEHAFGLEAVFSPSWQWEFYGKYLFRTNDAQIADDFEFSNTTSLGQFRTSYRLGYQWDLTGEVRWIHQTETEFDELGLLAELGYYVTPELRVAAGYSFGRTDDYDFSGSRSEGGPYLGVTLQLNNLLGDFGVQSPVRPRREAEETEDNAEVVTEETPSNPQQTVEAPSPEYHEAEPQNSVPWQSQRNEGNNFDFVVSPLFAEGELLASDWFDLSQGAIAFSPLNFTLTDAQPPPDPQP